MRRLLCLLLSAATLFLLASCDTAGSGGEETEPPPQGGADYTYGEDAEPVDLGETSVAQKTGSEIVFETSGSDLDIEEGEVIISDVPESELETAPRFLRKVEKVQEEGGQVTVETSQAALVDAVEEASLDFSTSVGRNSKKGRSTTWKVTSTAKGVKADGCESVQLKDVDLISSDALSAGLTNGAISFCPDITGEIDIGAFSIEKFSTVASGELTYSTDISATASATVENSGSVELAAFETYGIVGPVQYTMELSLVAGYEAQAGGTAGVTTGIESGGSLKLGARYEDGAWTPVSEQGLSFNARPVEWGKEAGVTVKGYVRPEITVFIYDTAGPSLFSGPYVELVAERSEDLVKDYRYGAFGGLNGGVGYDIEILTFDVAEYNKSLFELRTEIAGEGPTNPAPNDPEAPSPSSGATVGSRNPTLTWDASDPDNDDLTYDVHLGPSSSPAQVAGGLTSKSYETEGLQSGTTYNWKVVVTDQDGATTEGPVWSFTTPASGNQAPTTPNSPSPSDGATTSGTNPTLSWSASDPDGDDLTYDIYFGTSSSPSQVASGRTSASYDPGRLQSGTTYYWKVKATDSEGATTEGPVWNFVTPSSGSGTVPEEGLVAYYPFNGNANDESGNGIDGTVNGATLTTDRFGESNSAYEFDGGDDYIETSSSSALAVDDSLSITAWVKREFSDRRALSAQGTIFDTDGNWQVFIFKDSLEINKNNTNYSVRKSTSLSKGEWDHVVLTFASGTARFFVNGQLEAEGEMRTSTFNRTNDGIKIGEREYSSADNDFKGKIDDFRLYNRALSESEVQELFNAEK